MAIDTRHFFRIKFKILNKISKIEGKQSVVSTYTTTINSMTILVRWPATESHLLLKIYEVFSKATSGTIKTFSSIPSYPFKIKVFEGGPLYEFVIQIIFCLK